MQLSKMFLINNKKKLFLILISLFALGNSFNLIDDYNFTHWLFNYHYQFIKRGFVGQILYIFNIYPTLTIVYIFSYLILIIMFFVYVKFFYKAVKPFNDERGLFLYFLLVILHSATLQHYHYDIGRFDQIGIIATISLIFFLPKVPKFLQVIIITITFFILILIHEALFIMFGPLILSYWIYLEKNDKYFILLKIITFIFLGAVSFAISTFGLMKAISVENYYDLLSKSYGGMVDREAVLTLYRSFSDNIVFTKNIGFSIGHHILMLIVVLPVIFLLLILFYQYIIIIRNFNNKIKCFYYLLSALSPLLLYPIGVDRFRWISISITNLFIVIAILMQDKNFKFELNKTFEKYKLIVIITLILCLLLGPLEVGLSFSNNPSFKFITGIFGLSI